jgi:predicted nucleic acid-binding protein
MKAVFLDTVGILAILDEDDQWHAAAAKAYKPLLTSRRRLITTMPVLFECGNAAARRPYRNDVNDLRQRLREHGCLIEPGADDLDNAWAAYTRGDASEAGIVDQLSFAVMRRLGLTQAFTNDRHFVAAGFEALF